MQLRFLSFALVLLNHACGDAQQASAPQQAQTGYAVAAALYTSADDRSQGIELELGPGRSTETVTLDDRYGDVVAREVRFQDTQVARAFKGHLAVRKGENPVASADLAFSACDIVERAGLPVANVHIALFGFSLEEGVALVADTHRATVAPLSCWFAPMLPQLEFEADRWRATYFVPVAPNQVATFALDGESIQPVALHVWSGRWVYELQLERTEGASAGGLTVEVDGESRGSVSIEGACDEPTLASQEQWIGFDPETKAAALDGSEGFDCVFDDRTAVSSRP